MNKNNFFLRRGINLDITHRCALECPRCQRYRRFTRHGKKVWGKDISLDDIKKLSKFFNSFNFCGQFSDPVHHPKFIEILKYLNDMKITCDVHNASSAKSKDWYIKAFKAYPNARWIFGIDGLPEESHKYRVNQDGKKLFDIMLESKKYLKQKPHWQYIIFSYNENNVEKAKKIAKQNGLIMIIMKSSRWDNNNDPLIPNKKENILKRV